MNKVSLMEAWKLWLSGNQVHDSLLWGVNILWWGRIGKLVQFAAALTIIAEIIGPERLRSFGNSMHATFTLKKAARHIRDSMDWVKAIWSSWWQYLLLLKFIFSNPRKVLRSPKSISIEYKKFKEAKFKIQAFNADNINFLICLILAGVILYFWWPPLSWWRVLIVAFSVYVSLLLTISPVITILFFLIFALLGLLVDSFLIEPVAWVIERKHIDKWIKVISMLLILIGFHFDLLSS